jgi:hypothetical protein
MTIFEWLFIGSGAAIVIICVWVLLFAINLD